jgi:hypothetical protein
VIAEIWEGHLNWFGQMVDEHDGYRDRTVFVASSRGSIIAQITIWVPLSHLIIKDRLNPTMR